MKELTFEKMEEINGGSEYCDLLWYWINGGSGFQGNMSYLVQTFMTYCAH